MKGRLPVPSGSASFLFNLVSMRGLELSNLDIIYPKSLPEGIGNPLSTGHGNFSASLNWLDPPTVVTNSAVEKDLRLFWEKFLKEPKREPK